MVVFIIDQKWSKRLPILLPLRVAAPQAKSICWLVFRKRCSMTTRIMVINNSDNILAMFRKILEAEGYNVSTQLFLNSELRDVGKIKPDLIILDYYVGREGVGWEFLQLLKMEDSTSKVPVLLCTTAIKLVQEIGAYLGTKQVTFLRKPFESRDLVNTVQSILEDDPNSPATNLPESDESVKKKTKIHSTK